VKNTVEIPSGKRPDVAVLERVGELSGVFRSLRYRRPRWPYCSKPWCPSSRIYLENLGLFVEVSQELPFKGRVSVGLKQSLTSKMLASLTSLGPGGIHGGFKTRYHELFTKLSIKFLGEEPPGVSEVQINEEKKDLVKIRDKVVIVGAGLAGLVASLRLSEFGIESIIVDLKERLGGFLSTFEKENIYEDLNSMIRKISSSNKIKAVRGKYIGSYEEGKYVIAGNKVIEVAPEAPLIYSGGSEAPPPITKNNDLPGVISASYCLELLSSGSFKPNKIAVIGSNSWAVRVAEELSSRGIKTYLISVRKISEEVKGAEVIESNSVWFEGDSRVRYVKTNSRRIEVDAVVSAIEEYPVATPLYAVGYEPCLSMRDVIVPLLKLDFIKEKDLIIPAGSVLGLSSIDFSIKSGECAAVLAAKEMGKVDESDVKSYCDKVLKTLDSSYKCSSSLNERPEVWISGETEGLQFVDIDEDITLKDIIEAWKKGYRDMESIKRATGLGTGLDQGLFSAQSSVLILSFLYKTSPMTLGLFRSRPPHSLPQTLSLSGIW